MDAFTGQVWLVGEKSVVVLDRNGVLQASYRAPEKIEGLALSLNQNAWLLTQKSLIEINAYGSVIRSINTKKIVKDPGGLAVDSLANIIWVSGKHGLYRFNAVNLSEPPTLITLTSPGKKDNKLDAEALAINSVTGVLWLAGEKKLRAVSRVGELLVERDLKVDGVKEAEALSWDPVSGTLYLGGEKSLAQYGVDGALVWQLLIDKKLRALATVPFVIGPTISIAAPPDGVHTNNARPLIEFGLGTNCNGPGCELLSGYLDSLSIQAALDNNFIGSSFLVGGGSAKYLPPDSLAEGNHALVGQALDPFGHFSNLAQGTFIVDTISPVFSSVTPQDGTTVNDASIKIEGTTVDASPVNVTLLNNTGAVLSMAGATFSFLVPLEPGLNTFKLVAQDAAGNRAEKLLQITRGDPVKITINRPVNGTLTTSRSVLVTGTFEGPANTGVTVNGVVALVSGPKFSANGVSLVEGFNSVTATATTPSSLTATDSIVVTQSGTAQFAVDVALSRFEKQKVPGIDTYAGGGTQSIVGEVPAKEVALPPPVAVAVAPDGTIYTTDSNGCRILRVSPQQQISLFAGTGTCGFSGDGGPALDAQIYDPGGIEVAADGSIYFSDLGNDRIRRIGTDGIITTVAGNGVYGFSGDGGPATEAQISWAYDIALDNQGGLYIADADVHRIRYVSPNGVITTVAGTGAEGDSGDGGPALDATMSYPDNIALGPDGSVYIQDDGNNRIRRIRPDGIMEAFAGTGVHGFSGDGGPAIDAQFQWPWGLAVGADGALYITDSGNERVRKVTSDGIIETIAGNGIRGFGGDGGDPKLASFYGVGFLAVSADDTLYITDWVNRRVRVVSNFREENIKTPLGELAALAPFDAAFIVTHLNGGTITKIEVDFDGNGSADLTTTDATSPIEHSYLDPGLYNVTLKVTDDQGQSDTLTVAVLVMDAEEMDKQFQVIWNGMNQALIAGDIEKASSYLNGAGKKKYRPVFEALLTNMSEIVSSYSPLQRVSMSVNIGEYAINRSINGKNNLFFIYFLKDVDGIWRLDSM